MRRLTDPEQFLLDLSHTHSTQFHSKISTGDHHRHRSPRGASHDDVRQVPYRQRRLDLGHHCQRSLDLPQPAALPQFVMQSHHVVSPLHKRVTHYVRVLYHKVQMLAIPRGQSLQIQVRIQDIDRHVIAKTLALLSRLSHQQMGSVLALFGHHCAQLAFVKIDVRSFLQSIHHFG